MKNENKTSKVLLVLIAVLVVVAVVNQYTIMTSSTGFVAKSLNLVDYNEAGYQQLLKYDSTIRLNADQTKNYAGLDVELPCCGFAKLNAMGNCGCGHHIALSGLAKFMASKGYNKAEIQNEIDTWKSVFYPGGAPGVGSGAMGSC